MTREMTISAIRFGYGLGPERSGLGRADLLASLNAVDDVAKRFPVSPTTESLRIAKALREVRKKAGGRDNAEIRKAREKVRNTGALGLVHGMARILDSDAAFRERLLWFWADHFTAVPKNTGMRVAAPAYLDEAIRPHVTGRFADLLKSVITHPFMLTYLDQVASVGPNSTVGKRRGRGLNENLAREVMELHTLGVGASYTQGDVRQLAELMTGLTFSPAKGFFFNPRMAEPGAETVLGKSYGEKARLAAVLKAMDDLAAHPDTAAHLARKLAVHFVSDDPDPALEAAMTAAYLDSNGDLAQVYRAMIEHPAAWADLGRKAKQPFDFIASALVALGVSGKELVRLRPKELSALLFRPLAAMGQPFMEARGPDGWPEAAEAWITPQGLASRISWSMAVASKVAPRLGDGGKFLRDALADVASERLIWAVGQVDRPEDAVALVFASAEFNRR